MDAITVEDLQSIDMSLMPPQKIKRNLQDIAIEVTEFLGYGALMLITIGIVLVIIGVASLWGSLILLEQMIIHFPR